MSNEVSVPNYGVAKYADDKAFEIVSSQGNFLPRLQLFGANSNCVKEGNFPMAHYGLQKGNKDQIPVDLGKEAHVFILGWRPKALEIINNGESVNSVFNPKHSEFKRISEKSEIQDSGCMYGPEFLVYVAQEKVFATFFMASKTGRRAAGEVKAMMGKACTLKAKYIKTTKYSWHGPEVTICSTHFELPPNEEIQAVVEKFNNPPETEEETIPNEQLPDRET